MFSWIHFLTYACITTMTPGPNNIISMSNAGRLGLRKALPFNLGIFCGFSIVMLICTFFCSVLDTLIPKIKLPMLILGACYMLYLAFKTLKRSGEIAELTPKTGILSGLALEFVNPKIYIYGIVSMESYILPYFKQPIILIGFAILLAAIGCSFNLCWAIFGSIFKIIFSKYAKITNIIMALLLVYCAVSLFL